MRAKLPDNAVTIPDHAKRVFKGIIYDVYQWEQELFDGTIKTFEMLRRADTVKILAIEDSTLVVLEQEQPNRPPFYDIPGGMHDHPDETELDAAKRELLEETGLSFKTWKLLDIKQPNAKIEQFVYTFLATDIADISALNSDAGEKIKVHYLEIDKAKALFLSPQARFFPEALKRVNTLEELTGTHTPYK